MASKSPALPSVTVTIDDEGLQELRGHVNGDEVSKNMLRLLKGPRKLFAHLLDTYETDLSQLVARVRGGKGIPVFNAASKEVRNTLAIVTPGQLQASDADQSLKDISADSILLPASVGAAITGMPSPGDHVQVYKTWEQLSVLSAQLDQLLTEARRQENDVRISVRKNRDRQMALLRSCDANPKAEYSDEEIGFYAGCISSLIPELGSNETKCQELKTKLHDIEIQEMRLRQILGDLNASVDTNDLSLMRECIRQVADELHVVVSATRARLEQLGVGITYTMKPTRPVVVPRDPVLESLPTDLRERLLRLGLREIRLEVVILDARGKHVSKKIILRR